MATQLIVDADLEFSLELPDLPVVRGSLSGSGSALDLQVSHPHLFGGRADSPTIRRLAKGLADQGVSVRIVAPDGPLVTLGVARTSWLQRRLTKSRHIRIERGTALWRLLRGRSRGAQGGALPAASLVPPATLFPIAPMARRRRRPVTTTHDPARGGNPRLSLALGPHPMVGERPTVFALRDDVTTIGGDADCDIRLPGLEPVRAVIRHDDKDDFVVFRAESSGSVRVHGAEVESAILRTGAGVDLDSWQLTFMRDEYADHGRPYGGRIGGEFGHQRPQPSREWMLAQGTDDG